MTVRASLNRTIARIFYDDLFVQRRLARWSTSSLVKEQIIANLLRQIYDLGKRQAYTGLFMSIVGSEYRQVSVNLKRFPVGITDEVLNRIFDLPEERFLDDVGQGFVYENYPLIIEHQQSPVLALEMAFSQMAERERDGWKKVVQHPRATVNAIAGAIVLFSDLPTDHLERVIARDNSREKAAVSSRGYSENTLDDIRAMMGNRPITAQDEVIDTLRVQRTIEGDPQLFVEYPDIISGLFD